MPVQVFPFDPDWSSPVREKASHLTRVLVGRSGKEQRISLRTKPRRELSFSVFTEDVGQSQMLDSLLVDLLAESWGVPWWMDATQYSGTLPLGTTSIPVSTTGRMFVAAPMVLLWTSPSSWEAKDITSVSGEAIACVALSKAWTNPRVVPLFAGRLSKAQPVAWITSKISKASVAFEVNA